MFLQMTFRVPSASRMCLCSILFDCHFLVEPFSRSSRTAKVPEQRKTILTHSKIHRNPFE